MEPLLLFKLEDTFLVKVKAFRNRVLLCETKEGEILKVFYPGASKHMVLPPIECYVLIKAYVKPKPVCTHYLVAGDARIHSKVVETLSKPLWCGFTTLYNNKIFKAILDKCLWLEPILSYQTQCKVLNHRIDFYLPDLKAFCEIKADFALWFDLKNSRLFNHLKLLNQYPNSKMVFIAPYSRTISALENLKSIKNLEFLKSLKNITYYWIFVYYDTQGSVYFKTIESLE